MIKKKILITGGTGTFGTSFVNRAIKDKSIKKIFVYSRDEMKQWNMKKSLERNLEKVNFIIGDVRDYTRLNSTIRDNKIDHIIHAAATKIVLSAEFNPEECIKTNILGAMNLIEASKENKVKKVVALSTDKASSPINLYGATKLAADKLFISANLTANEKNTVFSIVRYGNVMGSRGSVIPFFLDLKHNQKFPITDLKMTRFMIDVDSSIDMVFTAINISVGGEIFIKKSPSMKVIDLAKAINPRAKFSVIGIRAGEKIHEQMFGEDESKYCYEMKDYYIILPSIIKINKFKKLILKAKKVDKNFIYSSDSNRNWLNTKKFNLWLKKYKDKVKDTI